MISRPADAEDFWSDMVWILARITASLDVDDKMQNDVVALLQRMVKLPPGALGYGQVRHGFLRVPGDIIGI